MAWTDERLDDGFAHVDGRLDRLEKNMDDGFGRTDIQIRDLRGEMNLGFKRVDKDIRELRGEVHGLRDDVFRFNEASGAEMTRLNEASSAEVDHHIEAMRAEMHSLFGRLESKIDRYNLRLFGALAAGFIALFIRG